LDHYFRKFRQFTGQELIAKKGDFDRLEGILKAGGVVATLGDQDAGQKGLFVDFFGRPASTHKAIALLALEHQANLVVTAARKLGEPMQYSIEATDAMTPADTAKMSVRSITERFTKAFESLIRRDPKQYFWLHRRWKHQPLRKGQKVA
jgi:KDO2-lipid IV(A) lauroyltransferase